MQLNVCVCGHLFDAQCGEQFFLFYLFLSLSHVLLQLIHALILTLIILFHFRFIASQKFGKERINGEGDEENGKE